MMMNYRTFAWCVYSEFVLISVITNVMFGKVDSQPKSPGGINAPRHCQEEHDADGQLIVSCSGLDWEYLNSELRMETAILRIDCEGLSLNMSFTSEFNQIKELNLISCVPTHLEVGLERLTELQVFHLSDGDVTDISYVTKLLSSLPKLSSLSLSTNTGLTTVRRADFLPLKSTSLRYLDLSGCHITSIDRDAFADVQQLQSFDFSQNPLSEVALRNLTIAIKKRQIGSLHLRSLSGLKGFPTAALRELKNTTIDDLDVSDNDFSEVPENGFNHPFLRNLKLSNSKVAAMHNRAFFETTLLETIDLRENRFTSVDNHFSWSQNLKFLDLSKHDSIVSENIKFEITEGSLDNLSCLEKLAINKVPIREMIRKYMFRGLKALRELQLSFVKIQSIEDFAFASLVSLEDLDLSSNEIRVIRKEMFYNLTNLRNLNLEGNMIQYFEGGDNSGNYPFESLKHLRVLNLNRNKISSISSGIFYGLEQLRSLRIQRNDLKSWNVPSLNIGNNVKGLHFGHNKISHITEAMLIDFSKFPVMETLDLSYNPFDCSTCDILKFHNWWKKRNTTLHLHSDSSAYICDYPMKTKGKTIFSVKSIYEKCLPSVSTTIRNIITSTSSAFNEEDNANAFRGNFLSTAWITLAAMLLITMTITSVLIFKHYHDVRRNATPKKTQLKQNRDCEGIVIEKSATRY